MSLLDDLRSQLNVDLLEPYQPNGVEWMYDRETYMMNMFDEVMPNGGILADEVGLGKTLLSVCMILIHPKPNTLVILI